MARLRDRNKLKIPTRYATGNEQLYGDANIAPAVRAENDASNVATDVTLKTKDLRATATCPAEHQTSTSTAQETSATADDGQKPNDLGLRQAALCAGTLKNAQGPLGEVEQSTDVDELPVFRSELYLPTLRDIVIERLLYGITPEADTIPKRPFMGNVNLEPTLEYSLEEPEPYSPYGVRAPEQQRQLEILFTELHPTIQMCILISIQDEAAAAWVEHPTTRTLVVSSSKQSMAVPWIPLWGGTGLLSQQDVRHKSTSVKTSVIGPNNRPYLMEVYRPGTEGAEWYPADRLLDVPHSYIYELQERQRAFIDTPEWLYEKDEIAQAISYLKRKKWPLRWLEGVWDAFDEL